MARNQLRLLAAAFIIASVAYARPESVAPALEKDWKLATERGNERPPVGHASTCDEVVEQWDTLFICAGDAPGTCRRTYKVGVFKGDDRITEEQSNYVYMTRASGSWIPVDQLSAQSTFDYDATHVITDDKWTNVSVDSESEVSARFDVDSTVLILQRVKRCGDLVWKAPVISIVEYAMAQEEFLDSPQARALALPPLRAWLWNAICDCTCRMLGPACMCCGFPHCTTVTRPGNPLAVPDEGDDGPCTAEEPCFCCGTEKC